MDRLVRVDVEPAIRGHGNPGAYCVERHDMVLAKLVRGEQRDSEYAKAAMKAGLLVQSILLNRIQIPDLPVDAEVRDHVETLVSPL